MLFFLLVYLVLFAQLCGAKLLDDSFLAFLGHCRSLVGLRSTRRLFWPFGGLRSRIRYCLYNVQEGVAHNGKVREIIVTDMNLKK